MPKNASANYNLQKINPAVAAEWHPTKNGELIPVEVTPNSPRKAWWICGRGHEWPASVANRNKGTGCPYCAGQKVCEDNCLQTVNPSLSKEWHPKKNGTITPKDVLPNTHKKAWWICSKNKNHEWEAIISNRNFLGRGCPYCDGKKVHEDNSLQTISPLLAKEWHPTKNGTLTPRGFTPNSGKKVW